jgi:hypothetical protein
LTAQFQKPGAEAFAGSAGGGGGYVVDVH